MVGDLASLTFRLGTCRALSAPAVTSSLRVADKTDFRAAAQPLRGNCFSGFRAKTFHPSPYLYKRDAPPKSARRSSPRTAAKNSYPDSYPCYLNSYSDSTGYLEAIWGLDSSRG